MLRIILLCTVLSHILARPLRDAHDTSSSGVKKPENVTTDRRIKVWVAVTAKVMKTIRETSQTKQKRTEKIRQLLEGIAKVPPMPLETLVELSDYVWETINKASPKVKEMFKRAYELETDTNFHKMDRDKKRAESVKLRNTLSENEWKETEEIRKKAKKKAKELGIKNIELFGIQS